MTEIAHERYLEISARLAALEFLVKQLFWTTATLDDSEGVDAIEPVAVCRQEAATSLRDATFPSLAPASSDHVAALAAEHVDRVLGELIEDMEEAYGIGLGGRRA